MYLLIKKPSWLNIISKEYVEGEKTNKLQIRQKDGKSNTKIIKCKDGSYYIRIGDEIFPIKSVEMNKSLYVTKDNKIKQEIKEKGFINNKKIEY